MAEPIEMAGVSKVEDTELTLFVPSVDQNLQPIDQGAWEQQALEFLGRTFGGATAFPKGRGVWRDDESGGRLIFDETIMLLCYTNRKAFEAHLSEFHAFLLKKGRKPTRRQ